MKRILIVGGGTAGWMTASLLQHAWASGKNTEQVTISLIESSDIGTIGVGEGSTPYLKHFFKKLGISEYEWMPQCNATYKTGIAFPNWSTKQGFESYFHPFFLQLDIQTGEAFMHNACLRRRGVDVDAHPDNYWTSTHLAKHRKSPIAEKALPFEVDYGYHFDSGLLGSFLKQRAIKLGVQHIVDTVTHVETDKYGNISTIHSNQFGPLAADFFIDCSGFQALLIEKTLNTDFISFSDNLFNDRAVAIASDINNEASIPSHTQSEALSNGWRWKIPLTNRFGNGYVYCSSTISDEKAEQELRTSIGKNTYNNNEARLIKMRVGRRTKHWHKNCLAVGLSQGFIEPLEATALALIQLTVEKFIQHYGQAKEKPETLSKQQDTFNQSINAFFEGIRDYIVCHYKTNSRSDSEYWQENRTNTHTSSRLNVILQSWHQGTDFEATLTEFAKETFYFRPSWYCLLAGTGQFPKNLHPPTQKHTYSSAEDARAICSNNCNGFRSHKEQLQHLVKINR